MGELYLDNIERTAARENARAGRPSIASRPERRFVADPDARPRCCGYGKPVRRPRHVEGTARCAVHAPADAEKGTSGELMAVLQDWFGHDAVRVTS